MNLWRRLFGKKLNQSETSPAPQEKEGTDALLSIGLHASQKSIVQAEIHHPNRSSLVSLTADEATLRRHLANAQTSGELDEKSVHGALAAYKRGDYHIKEQDGKFALIFYGMPSPAENHQAAMAQNSRMNLIKGQDAPTCEICGQPAQSHTMISRKYFRLDEEGNPAVVHAGWCMSCLFTRQHEHKNPTQEEAIALARREMKG